MPSNLETSATFGELIVRLAARIGHADQTGAVAGVPTDANTLAEMKRCVNEGYDRFLRARQNWSFRRRTVILTFDTAGTGPQNYQQDAGRYVLPGYVAGPPLDDWVYLTANTTQRQIKRVHPNEIDVRRVSQGSTTGAPVISGMRTIESTGPIGTSPTRWEATFYPIPDAAYMVQAPFRVVRHEMVELSERHCAGAEHDAAIIAYAAWVWFEDDAEDRETAERYRVAAQGDPARGIRGALQESIELDETNHPDTVGYSAPFDNSAYRPHIVETPDIPLIGNLNGTPIGY